MRENKRNYRLGKGTLYFKKRGEKEWKKAPQAFPIDVDLDKLAVTQIKGLLNEFKYDER